MDLDQLHRDAIAGLAERLERKGFTPEGAREIAEANAHCLSVTTDGVVRTLHRNGTTFPYDPVDPFNGLASVLAAGAPGTLRVKPEPPPAPKPLTDDQLRAAKAASGSYF